MGSVLAVVVLGAFLFGAAGRFDIPVFWLYLATWGLYMTATYVLALRVNPDLVRERMKPPSDRDRMTRRMAAFPGFGHLIVAGLDVGRYHWSSVSWAGHGLGFVLLVTGMSFVAWTFMTNRFASTAVRIQHERNQTVITTGPYAIVRHPMYLGTFMVALGSPLALGSWWSLLAVFPIIPIFIRRTLLEDAMLHDELPGYRDYATKTKWRIVPGVF